MDFVNNLKCKKEAEIYPTFFSDAKFAKIPNKFVEMDEDNFVEVDSTLDFSIKPELETFTGDSIV